MKILISMILFFQTIHIFGQSRPVIKISVDQTTSKCFDSKTYKNSKYKSSIDSAFVIMNSVFNSIDFQQVFDTIQFPCWNKCIINECSPSLNCKDLNIDGKRVLDSLFNETAVTMSINFRKRGHNALGATCPKNYNTNAFYKNIKADMPKLPLSYAIAVNLCHEYMHHIGFCHLSNSFNEPDEEHPDPIGYKNDIAYRVGWDAYYILKKWKEQGRKII